MRAVVATAQNQDAVCDLYYSILESVEAKGCTVIHAEVNDLQITVIYDGKATHTKAAQKKPVNTVKQLQKEAKAYNQVEVFYDVYSDRLNFVGFSNTWLVDFFKRRNVIADSDRSGYSIDIKDAIALGFPTKANSYRLLPDARKAPIAC
jgi:hypothetical protein